MRIKDKSKILCEWMLYDSRTICPKEHSDKCDGSKDKPFWRIDAGYIVEKRLIILKLTRR